MSETTVGEGEQSNLEFVRALFEQGWNRGSFDFMAGRTAAVVPFHYNGQALGTDSGALPSLVAEWRRAFPDMHFEIEQLIADGDRVAVWLVLRGTHQDHWWGAPPSGASVEVQEVMFFRFEGGTLVEMWELFDEQSLRRQIGAPPQ